MTDLEEAVSPCFGPPPRGDAAEILAERLLERTAQEVDDDIVMRDLRALARSYGDAMAALDVDAHDGLAADGGAEAVALAQTLRAQTERGRPAIVLSRGLAAMAMALTALVAALGLLLGAR
jgi:hypothetical protein